jgi:hypothetical protein
VKRRKSRIERIPSENERPSRERPTRPTGLDSTEERRTVALFSTKVDRILDWAVAQRAVAVSKAAQRWSGGA